MKKYLKQLILSRLLSGSAKDTHDALQSFPPGHFYSPIPSLGEVRRDEALIFGDCPRQIPGIEMNEEGQLRLLDALKKFYAEIPSAPEKSPELRFYFNNSMYSYSDAIFLHCMIRQVEPKRIIEIGSGFSSCMTLDTNEKFFDNGIETTFIEPYPERLLSLLLPGDEERINILPHRLQDIDLNIFEDLRANDILFVDSTHVSKVGSDVNRIFFEILPRLAPGVYIHFHDILYPFEYPRDWIYAGRSWNEAYLLRAFLQHNNSFNIILMNSFIHKFHDDFFCKEMPLCRKNTGGSIWLRTSPTA